MSKDFDHVWTSDFETDPFKVGRIPKPFSVGLYKGDGDYSDCWADDITVIDWIVNRFHTAPDNTVVYFHNGGKFDFHFFKDHIRGNMKIIGGRIAECKVGNVTLRDSFSLLPVGLGGMEKTEIDYDKMEADVREQHKEEILSYQKDDCVFLHNHVTEFINMFGTHLTMAGAAIKQLKKFHDVEKITSEGTDKQFRKFYYGGRVQCIQRGILEGDFKVYDVNSMYPSVMKDQLHPISSNYTHYFGKHARAIVERCDFAHIRASNDGALPRVVNPDTAKAKLSFEETEGEFFATGHEIRAGLKTGRLKIHDALEAYKAESHGTFDEFIDYYYTMRLRAKANGDDMRTLFYKLVMNSAYGKFAQNPDDFKDWCIVDDEYMEPPWLPELEFDNGWIIYSRPTSKPLSIFRYNIMTAASITGAARALLLEGLHNAVNPVYCDTDSIICESLNGDLDEKRLGAWKLEASGDSIAIAGKKLYAVKDKGELVKHACKGVRITPSQIYEVASGGEVTYENQAPTFSITKETRFIKRTVRATA